MGRICSMDDMTERRALALALMALAHVIEIEPQVVDWRQAREVVRELLEVVRELDDARRQYPNVRTLLQQIWKFTQQEDRMSFTVNGETLEDIRYSRALEVVRRVDEHLRLGTRHYRDVDGELLADLNQVIEAALAGRLAVEEPAGSAG